MAEPTFNDSSSRQRGHGCWPAHLRPLALTWTLPFFGHCSVCGSVFLLQALMAIAPCATGSRTALEITHGLARAVGTVQNVTTAFEQFWLPKPLLLGSAQRLKRWDFCRNDPRNLEPVRSAGPPFPSEDLQMCTYPTGGPMDLPSWTLQPPVVCGAQCWPPLLATGLRQLQTTRSEKRSTTILPSCVLDKAYSSSRWWLKPAAAGGARPPLPPSEKGPDRRCHLPKIGRFARFSTWDVCE